MLSGASPPKSATPAHAAFPCQAFTVEPMKGFAPYRAFKYEVTQGENGAEDKPTRVIRDSDEWVKSFRKRYSGSTKDKEAAERILTYVCRMHEEYLNSEPPAAGFQRIVTKICCKFQCNKFGQCMANSCTK